MTRKCSGVVPQQPPMMRAPESNDRRAYSAISSGVPLKRICAVDELRNAAVRLGDENGGGIGGRGQIDHAGDEFGGSRAAIAAASRKRDACGAIAPVPKA